MRILLLVIEILLSLLLWCLGGCHHRTAVYAAALDCPPSLAIPDDGIDDTAAIQAGLDANGCVNLGAGTYDIVTPGAVPPARRPYAMLTLAHAELAGVGASTKLHFTGNAGGLQDWYGVALGSGRLRDLELDIDLTNTVEQTHAVRVTGPSDGASIVRVTFNHPQRGSQPGGDCVQVVGYPGQLVTGLRITDSTFAHCDRSGVAIHSGASDIAITGCSFQDTGDQDIDGEGTGNINGVLIDRCTFGLGSAPQGSLAIQLESTTHARVSNSTLTGRGIQLDGCSSCELDHVTVARTVTGSSLAVIDITKDSAGVNVHDSDFSRAASATAGPVIRIAPHNGQPSDITIATSAVAQHTNASAIVSMGVVGLSATDLAIAFDGSGEAYGLDITGSPTVRTDHAVVSTSTFTGPLTAAVRLSGSYAGAGALVCTGDRVTGAAHGLRCETPSGILGPLLLTDDVWPDVVCTLGR